MMDPIHIGDNSIGTAFPVYVIAEAGVNHNGNTDMALELVRQAKSCGADCVKFQTFKAERVVSKDAPKADYQLEVTSKDESQFEMLKKLELAEGAYLEILQLGKQLGIEILSTPYNHEDADFLHELGLNAFKIASGQLIEHHFLEYVARKNKPLILSTGMGTEQEVESAVQVIKETGNDQLVVLQCTTNYPSRIEDSNLRAMISMGLDNQVLVGYSDHVESNYAVWGAVAMSGCVIEKHFTLDRTMAGPDHSSSLDPDGFKKMIFGIRQIEQALGNTIKMPSEVELRNLIGMRRSIVAKVDIEEGTRLAPELITFKRPATGLSPALLKEIIGKQFKTDVRRDQQITLDHLQD